MKLFLVNVLAFAGLILLFNIMIFAFASKYYFDPYLKVSDQRSFMFADSHGVELRNTAEKYGVYNFSFEGDSYTDMYRKIKHLIRQGTSIDTVFLSADDHTLSFYREDANNLDRSVIYTDVSDFSNVGEYIKKRYLLYYFPILQPKIRSIFREFLIKLIRNPKKGVKLKNWSQLTDQVRQEKSYKRMVYQFVDENTSVKLRESLLNIIKVCDEKNIVLFGVKFPITREYGKITEKKSYGADRILRNNGVSILNFRNVFVDKPEYFRDQDHLNELGGEKLAELLYEASN